MLERVERDSAWADLALHAALRESGLPRADRALATELTYGSLRLRGRLDAALAQALDRPVTEVEPAVRNALRLGAYQLLFMDRIEPKVAVSATVDLVRSVGRERAVGFTNAVLRALSALVQDRALRFPDPDEQPVAYLTEWGSLPEWIAAAWVRQFGVDEAIELAEASLRPPPRTVRVSATSDVDDVATRLRGRRCARAPRGVTGCATDPVAEPGFERGEWTVQDEASQLVGVMVDAQPGMTVVDCCAAPGTKTFQLAEAVGPGGEVIALDSNESRLSFVYKGAERLRLRNVRPLVRDVAKGFDLRGPQSFPRVLVDAPCSGLGVLRRNPDARWRIGPDDVSRLADRQRELVSSAARYVDRGGTLVYSVCTFTPEETDGVARRFLEAHDEWTQDGELRTLPHRDGCDGFYATRFVRRSPGR